MSVRIAPIAPGVDRAPAPFPVGARPALPMEGLARLIQHQLENLSALVGLEHGGSLVGADAFSLSPPSSPDEGQRALSAVPAPAGGPRRSSLSTFDPNEPRLGMIGSLLGHIVRSVTLERDGQAVSVDGFRLTNLERWAHYECPSLLDNISLETVSSACSCDCDFCFLKGWGPLPLDRRFCTMREARTRKKYYSVEKKQGLPVPASVPGEPFLNPQTLNFMRMAREAQPDAIIALTTNGDFLDEPTVRELARLKPVFLVVSLNAADQEHRRSIMKSRRPAVAVEAIPLLQAYGIQYVGSIVASPAFGLAGIAETARYLDRHETLMVRLLLPGYSRYQEAEPALEAFSWWDQVVELARELRASLEAPVFIQPNIYWDRDITPTIKGIYRNSPAARAGLRLGDTVTAVDGRPVSTSADVIDAFGPRDGNKSATRQVTVQRGSDLFTVALAAAARDDDLYPYKPRGYPLGEGFPDACCLGLNVPEGFRLESLAFLKQCIDRHPGARRVLLFTTALMKDHLLQALRLAGRLPECDLGDAEVRLTVAEHTYWGGNILVGDLHVVQDYIDHLRRLEAHGYRPELVLIPGSFVNRWQLDLTGRSFQEIERRTGIPVELVPTKRIMW